jgi:hypothetical protein
MSGWEFGDGGIAEIFSFLKVARLGLDGIKPTEYWHSQLIEDTDLVSEDYM